MMKIDFTFQHMIWDKDIWDAASWINLILSNEIFAYMDGGFPAQRGSNTETVFMLWHHHEIFPILWPAN